MKSSIITQVKKRDGSIALFNSQKICDAIFRAAKSVGGRDYDRAKELTEKIIDYLEQKGFSDVNMPTVENVQDSVEKILIEEGHAKTAKAFIIYREQHKRLREFRSFVNSNDIMDGYLRETDWRVKENSNMSYSLQGLNNHISSIVSSNYWLHKVYPPEVRDAHVEGDFHLHDLQILASYCCGWDLQDLLFRGFGGVSGKVVSNPPKHLRAALGQMANFIYTLQGEGAGAQAFSSFDTLLAPFIRYDNLSYKEVKQAMQEFVFNMNVPTRVGFQCMSEDTEILTENGWRVHNQVKKGDMIATFNIEKGFIEYLPVKRLFAKEYKGKMYNLKNRISDQLISPEHRVVRKLFNVGRYALEKIEKVLELKSPFIVPVGSEGHVRGDDSLDENIVELLAWVISEGSMDKGERGSGRISIYQSKKVNPGNYERIISICDTLGFSYTERTQEGLGEECNVIRFDAQSTRRILGYFKGDKHKGIKFIPGCIMAAGGETSRLFLENYIQRDGHEGCKISTAAEEIKDGLLQVAVNAGYGATVLMRKQRSGISKKDLYVLRLIRHKDTYITEVRQVNYSGVIWCPNTDNETVVARRKGKVFITGNTPFSNLTFDLKPPKALAKKPAIVGGKPMSDSYGDFQKEMDLINRAFAEVMLEGDASGKVFTFPIPTYNVTSDLDWDNPEWDLIWEMTAKYGMPYFANFINSEMDPEDARSMCCRLRLDNRELRRKGGVFGSHPLTGSLGVVTLNLPRLGHIAKGEEDFMQHLFRLMDIASLSLEIKRKSVENFTDLGLYPYSRYYLKGVKDATGGYWSNHFNTIGIIGMNEACLNLFGKSVASEEGRKFALRVMDAMLVKLAEYQRKTGSNYNLEATPAEGATYRLAKLDKEKFPEIITAGDEEPYYTNSTHLPVNYTDDIFEALQLQDDIQAKYTGGTVLHGFLGERIDDIQTCKKLVKRVATNFKLPYFTLTPTFSICPVHGYLRGEHFECPHEHTKEQLEAYGIVKDFKGGEKNV